MTNPIEIEGLTKRFGASTALDGLTMQVEQGEIHGFLGPNGAGKSTTIRILLGLLRKDSGRVRLLDGDPWHDAPALHRRLAYVPGDVSLWPNLSGGEAIDLLGRARGGLNDSVRDELIARFDLNPRRLGRTYSKGNRQKVALVAALASPVELLLLDEPTSGLDPLMERTFTQVIRERAEQGCTVLLSSHILSEVEALCRRVSIIRAGRIVESGSLGQLRHLRRSHVTATVAHEVPDLANLAGVHNCVVTGNRWEARVDNAALSTVLTALGQAGVKAFTATPPTLEELFLAHYENAPAEMVAS